MVMVMAEDEILEKKLVVREGGESGSGSESKSPWNRPVDKPVDSAVMESETWPALSDVQRPKSSEGSSKPPPPATEEESVAPLAATVDSQVIID